jgi:hypothetical protein
MKRLLLPLISIAVLAFTLVPTGASAASQKDACKGGGYLTLVRSDGTSFKNQGQCVSYAVRGGTLFRALDASSVFTAQIGAGGPAGPPDANGNLPGGTFDGGIITGAFSAPSSCVPPFCGNFSMRFSYLVHPSTGMVDGTGTAACDPCVVAGLTGTASLTTTVVGHELMVGGLVFGLYDSGTWQIATATGDLAAISGAGTWTEGTGHTRLFAGKIFLPI